MDPETVQATGMPENAEAGRKGGGIARKARRELEQKTGRSVVTGEDFLPPAATGKRLGNRTSTARTVRAVDLRCGRRRGWT